MSIIDWLNEKYPVKPYLIFPDIHRNLVFDYGDNFTPEMQQRFQAGLHDLGLDLSALSTAGKNSVNVLVSSENGVPFFEIGGLFKIRFPEGDPVDAMLWSAYALASQNGWITEKEDIDVALSGYNIAGQKVAASVMMEIQNRFGTVPDVESIIHSSVKEYAKRFAAEAPSFSNQFISEAGMEYIENTGKLFKKSDYIRLDDLAERLFGLRKNFRDEIELYCSYVSSSSRYHRELEKAVEYCTEKLYALPVYRLKESVENAKSAILEDYNYKELIHTAEDKLRNECVVKKIKPDSLPLLFAEIEPLYSEAVRTKVYLTFLYDLVGILSDKVEKDSQETITNLKVIAYEAKQYCTLTPRDYGAIIRWDSDGNLDFSKLRIQDAAWDASAIQMIQMRTWMPDGYENRVWFAGDKVSAVASMEGSLYSVQQVPGLDDMLLYGLFVRKFRKEE